MYIVYAYIHIHTKVLLFNLSAISIKSELQFKLYVESINSLNL